MNLLGNIVWLVFGGLISAFLWVIAGLLLCLTIIGIPFGVQCFKIAGFVIWPFGRDVTLGNFGMLGILGNIVWILVCGIELCFTHVVFGLLLCLTVIGIPFGIQHFKLAKLALVPFGAEIYSI